MVRKSNTLFRPRVDPRRTLSGMLTVKLAHIGSAHNYNKEHSRKYYCLYLGSTSLQIFTFFLDCNNLIVSLLSCCNFYAQLCFSVEYELVIHAYGTHYLGSYGRPFQMAWTVPECWALSRWSPSWGKYLQCPGFTLTLVFHNLAPSL